MVGRSAADAGNTATALTPGMLDLRRIREESGRREGSARTPRAPAWPTRSTT